MAPNGGARKVPKELKGSATLYVEQKYDLTSTPGACVPSCICIRRWPIRPSVEREAQRLCKLYLPQYRGMPGPRSGSGWAWKWVGECVGDFWDSIGNVNEINT